MYINRALLLVLGIALVFMPDLAQWLSGDTFVWYRPYQLWLLIILAVYWNQRSRYPDEL